jgi:phosphate transport system substrate-binding protein
MELSANGSVPSVRQERFARSLRLQVWLFSLLTLGLGIAPAMAQDAVVIVGSGSSVPAPLYTRWTSEYRKHNIHIQMRYLPSGTSEGIKQIAHGASDFGAGEAPLSDKEKKEDGLVELPVVIIGIVPIYNLPDVHQELRLSGEVLAAIFLGDVKMWNAPQIAKLNPDISLPSLPIQVVNRPSGKGSNYVFTDFLSKVSSKFRAQVGTGASPKWPVGDPAERSSDMADKVKSTPGSIGYVEYQYAVKSNIAQAAVLNAAGNFVKASTESIAAACLAAESPQWNKFSASLANTHGDDSFPIASFTWIYLRTKSTDSARAAALANFLDWMYTDGEKFAVQEGYSELPVPLLAAVRDRVKNLQ